MASQRGTESKIALWVGATIVVAGTLVLASCGVYAFSREFFGSPDIPLAVQIAAPAVLVGVIILLGTALMDRLRHRKQEHFKEAEY